MTRRFRPSWLGIDQKQPVFTVVGQPSANNRKEVKAQAVALQHGMVFAHDPPYLLAIGIDEFIQPAVDDGFAPEPLVKIRHHAVACGTQAKS